MHLGSLTHILHHQFLTVGLAQVKLERATKQFKQHFKACLGDGRVVPTFAELVSDKGICHVVSQRPDSRSSRQQNYSR